jgi:ornithine cyclodeaminase/alanine dehydrogenase-like protein (mu-crystallin family)
MNLYRLPEIRTVVPRLDLVELMAGAFAAYSEGRAEVAPVAELLLDAGDVHVKSGYLRGAAHYVVKVAAGFPANPGLGLSSSQGLMLLFDQRTGALDTILLDEGYLTDLRTAAAGALAARLLAPPGVRRLAIFGTGIQARLQLDHLRTVTDCRRAIVWGRTPERVAAFADHARELGFDVETSRDAAAAAAAADLIVTATAATAPLFPAAAVRPGTHVTAVGSDTPVKQELDPTLLARADRVVADSIAQCRERGEIHRATAAGAFDPAGVVELGAIVAGRAAGRTAPAQITVADLTGVAVQDVEIARAAAEALARSSGAGPSSETGPE